MKGQHPTGALTDYVPAIITFAILATALYVIVTDRHDPIAKHWATGAVGGIMGYWLRGTMPARNR